MEAQFMPKLAPKLHHCLTINVTSLKIDYHLRLSKRHSWVCACRKIEPSVSLRKEYINCNLPGRSIPFECGLCERHRMILHVHKSVYYRLFNTIFFRCWKKFRWMNFTVQHRRGKKHFPIFCCHPLDRETQSRAASGGSEAGQGPTGL